jgi:hypothetical protein
LANWPMRENRIVASRATTTAKCRANQIGKMKNRSAHVSTDRLRSPKRDKRERICAEIRLN